MVKVKIGIIGGSGLYRMKELSDVEEVKLITPFGEPSDVITVGKLEGIGVAFLPRHGKGHRISPSNLPVRANIYALKSLGVERIISINAVGSLKEEIEPLHFVLPDQIIDLTKGRPSTFFTDGVVGHISFAQPFCPILSQVLFEAAIKTGATAYKGGTYLAMEGPQFSTKAESHLYRSWGVDVIGMTGSPEAKLAREAEICYAMLGFATDYDCWHPNYASVTAEMILTNLKKSVNAAREILKLAIPMIPQKRDCICATALKTAIATSPKYISDKAKRDLDPIIGKYLKNKENVT
ncbi:MAG: S-methyl-5'-thioadenosine phosphorylase [Chloroflexota bacterium]|nr:S-methyl-5'-thioadenosine phosphorylase [Chloroflexota bacterium]